MANPLKLSALMADALPSPTSPRWDAEMRAAITRGHLAAWMSGTAERLGVPLDSPLLSRQRLSKSERADIKRVVDKQLDYLKGFEKARGDMSEQAIAARSQMYVGALRPTYYGARWGDYEIPEGLMPGNQTCLTNCKCSVSITDNDDGTGTLTRTLGSEKSCDECPGLAGDHTVKRREG